jgi:two-component system LytT family response regulator
MLTPKKNKTNSIARIIHLQTDTRFAPNLAQKPKDRLLIRTSEKTQLLYIENILFFEADGNYTRVYLSNGEKLYCSKALKVFEVELSQTERFMRVHQSFLVRKDAIDCYYHIGHLKLKGSEAQIPVSRRKKAQILNFFECLQSNN